MSARSAFFGGTIRGPHHLCVQVLIVGSGARPDPEDK